MTGRAAACLATDMGAGTAVAVPFVGAAIHRSAPAFPKSDIGKGTSPSRHDSGGMPTGLAWNARAVKTRSKTMEDHALPLARHEFYT